MPQKNVAKIVKKEVKKQERKKQNNRPKRVQRNAVKRRANVVTKGAGRAVVSKLESLAIGASAERRQAVELAKRLCCPNMYTSYAVQDGFNSQPVGVASPFMVLPAPLSTTTGTAVDANGVPNSEFWIFGYRDPHRALLYYDAVPRTFEYNGVVDSGATTNNWASGASIDFDAYNYSTGVDVWGSKVYTGVVATGKGAGYRFIMMNKAMYIKVTGLPATTGVTLTFYLLSEDEIYPCTITATTTGGGVGTFNMASLVQVNSGGLASIPAFYHAGAFSVSAAVTNGTFSVGGTSIPIMRQLSLAQFQSVYQVIEKLRFDSLNIMYSNTANVQTRGGFIAGWQAPSDLDPFAIMALGFDNLANRPGSMRITADEGAHMFWKSTDIRDWEFADIGDPAGNVGASGGSNYLIDADQDFLVMCVQQPDVNQRSGYVSLFSDVEFRHSSVWLPQTRPSHSRRVFEEALEIQGKVPFLHCNPFHVSDIFKWIGNHKNAIKGTISGIGNMSGAQGSMVADRANQFLDLWIK